jgi:probable rRNA maturation factor
VLTIRVANQQTVLPVDRRRIRSAVRTILKDHAIGAGEISVAVVDDATMARLHREYLLADEPTDVLSFLLESADGYLEGEIVVSAETAAAAAPGFGLSPGDEVLLYVIHGMLHLVGYDDTTPRKRAAMRSQERMYVARIG